MLTFVVSAKVVQSHFFNKTMHRTDFTKVNQHLWAPGANINTGIMSFGWSLVITKQQISSLKSLDTPHAQSNF